MIGTRSSSAAALRSRDTKVMTIRYATRMCSLGHILIAATENGICAVALGDDPQELVRLLRQRFSSASFMEGNATFRKTARVVTAFTEEPSQAFTLPLDLHGTAFQQKVWRELRKIPAGTTATYADIALRIGRPEAVRAVARACGANPVAIAVPCHRVIRSDGSLSGYRWGTARKAKLLANERKK